MEIVGKIIETGIPLYIVQILRYWYGHQDLCASLGNTRSRIYNMSNGIRQGSILSPHLFNVYVDDLNFKLNEIGVGCHIAGTPTNNLLYADDLVLLAPCASALNELLSVCYEFANDNHITVFSVLLKRLHVKLA